MSEPLKHVKLKRVVKLFGSVRALAGVDLEAASGEVLAVMGPNGAGKSTLLSILALAARPTAGEVLFDDRPARASDSELRARIGLLSHQPLVYPDLTVRENLLFFARLFGVSEPAAAVTDIERRLDLIDFCTDRPTRVLSRGQLQRLALGRALISSPRLLLLDEPAAGLDAAAVGRIEVAVRALREAGGLAVVVTHEPELAARLATRAVMLRRGKVCADQPAPGRAEEWRELYTEAVEGATG